MIPFLKITLSQSHFLKGKQISHQRSNSTHAKKPRYDILISGSSSVGNSLFYALANARATKNLRVGIIESHHNKENSSKTNDQKVSALNIASIQFLKAINAWDSFSSKAVPYYEMIVWNSTSPGTLHFSNDNKLNNSDQSIEEPLGYIIDNNTLKSALENQIKNQQSNGSFDMIQGETIESVVYPSTHSHFLHVHTKSGKELITNLLIETGNSLNSQKILGIRPQEWKYHQKAITALVQHNQPNRTCWQRFLPTGPISLLPISESQSSLIWCTNPTQRESLLKMSGEQFVTSVNQALNEIHPPRGWSFLESSKSYVSSLSGFPSPSPPLIEKLVKKQSFIEIGARHVHDYVKPRVALVGHYLHSHIHPLADHGINAAFADVASITSAIVKSLEAGNSDVGSASVLDDYEESRITQQAYTLHAVDSTRRMFESNFFPLPLARNATLTFTKKDDKHPFAIGENFDLSSTFGKS